jgi:single-stranded-DNA-specific exonuclease
MDGGPWGQAFAEPMFDGRFEVISSRVVGDKHWKLVLSPVGSDLAVDAIAFNACETLPVMPQHVHAAYRLDENEWQGRVNLQLRIEYMQEA